MLRSGHLPLGASWTFSLMDHSSEKANMTLGVPCIPSPNLHFERVGWVVCTLLIWRKKSNPIPTTPSSAVLHLCPLPAVLSTWGCCGGSGNTPRAPTAFVRGDGTTALLEMSELSFQWRGASYFVAQLFIFIEFEASCTWKIHPFVAAFEDN